MTMPFDRSPRSPRSFKPRRHFKETFWKAKARVLSVLPIAESDEFEVILVGGGDGGRMTFLCDALTARHWIDRRDAGTFVEIGVREWLRSSNERRT